MSLDRKFIYGTLYGLALALAVTGGLLVIARRPPGRPVQLAEAPTPIPLRVYVLGAVAQPGVYPVARNSIVQEALALAGGALPGADLHLVNLAQVLQDGDRITVPAVKPTATAAPPTATPEPGRPVPTAIPSATAAAATGPLAPGEKINLNTATAADLDRLPRIGPTTAQRIVDYRDQHGPFQKPEDLLKVKGLGAATFEQIKDFVTVD